MASAIDLNEHFPGFFAQDALFLIAGDLLGEGDDRKVYRYGLDETKVIKFEHSAKRFCNIMEWEMWCYAKEHSQIAKWLAPCRHISLGGHILIQDYAKDVPIEKLPAKVPAFFYDLSPRNWGQIGHNFVARDYANNSVMQNGMTKRMKNVKWRTA